MASRLPFRILPALAGLALALGAGCASSDLSKSTEINDQVVEALPVGTPAPADIERALWFPNANGMVGPDATPLGRASGVLVLAGDQLFFMAWNDSLKAYDVLHTIAVPPAIKFEVARMGMSTMLVVESKSMQFDSFELMRGGQFAADPEKTEALCAKLKEVKAKNPLPDYTPQS